MCFRDAFGMGFGVISGLFWETFRYQNDAQKEKGRFVELLVSLCNIAIFTGLGLHLGCQKDRKTEWDAELDAKSVLSSFRDHCGVIWGAKIVKTATWIDRRVVMRWRVPKARFSETFEPAGR